mgnify:CR=1 FL=1
MLLILCILLSLNRLFPVDVDKIPDVDVVIKVITENKHPFLIDHERSLIILKKGIVQEKIKLYPVSNGTPPIHYFFDAERSIRTFIDSNGSWIMFNRDGKMISYAWEWQTDLPIGLIGKYEYDRNTGDYKLVKLNESPSKDDVYIFKDPD